MNLVRWGVIGLGIGREHAETLMRTPDAEVVFVCDHSRGARQDWADRHAEVPALPEYDPLLARGGIDALVIAGYDDSHGREVISALQLGVHVFVEKPVATRQSELEQIATLLASQPKVQLATNTLLRLSPKFHALGSQIVAGELGVIYYVEADYIYGRLHKLAKGWRGEAPEYSVTLGGAIHMIDLVMWLLQERPEAVVGVGSGEGLRNSEYGTVTRFDGEDFRVSLMKFPSGKLAKVSANFAAVAPHVHRLDVFGSHGTTITEFPNPDPIEGRRDSATSGSLRQLRGREGPESSHSQPERHGLGARSQLLVDFHHALVRTGDYGIRPQEAIDPVSVALAIDQSIKERAWTNVRYLTAVSETSVSPPGGGESGGD